jgi:hypothetical protein
MRDNEMTGILNKYLEGSTIITSKMTESNIEGGFSIVFKKDNKIGIIVFGYTELGEWIEWLYFDGNDIIMSDYYGDNLKKEFKNIISE